MSEIKIGLIEPLIEGSIDIKNGLLVCADGTSKDISLVHMEKGEQTVNLNITPILHSLGWFPTPQKMSEWQPIETAPLSIGILVCNPGDKYARYAFQRSQPPRRGAKFQGPYGVITPEPTLWMPMPSPPEQP